MTDHIQFYKVDDQWCYKILRDGIIGFVDKDIIKRYITDRSSFVTSCAIYVDYEEAELVGFGKFRVNIEVYHEGFEKIKGVYITVAGVDAGNGDETDSFRLGLDEQ